jgi:hypothetical protein
VQTAVIENITVLDTSHVALLMNRRKITQLPPSSMKDEAAGRFYERESFLRLPDQPMRLVRRATIALAAKRQRSQA